MALNALDVLGQADTPGWTKRMPAQNIAELIDSLTPQEQEAVFEFIRFLESRN